MDEKKVVCADCPGYVYKGDDEQYCQWAKMRQMWLKRWQDRPKWCPAAARQRRTGATEKD